MAAVFLSLVATAAQSQTYKTDFSTKTVLAGGGNDPAHTLTLMAPASPAAGLTFTFPANAGTSGYVLKTDGAGNMSWVDPAAAFTLGGDVTGVANNNAIATAAANDIIAALNSVNATTPISTPVALSATSLTASGGGTISTTGTISGGVIDGGTGTFTGAVSAVGLTSTGGLSASGGTTNIAATDASAVNIGTGSGNANAIDIGNSGSTTTFAGTVVLPNGSVSASSIGLAHGEVLIGDNTGKAAAQSISQDVTITDAGVATVGGSSAATFAVSGNETVAGTLGVTGTSTLGTVSAGAITGTSLSAGSGAITGGNLTASGNVSLDAAPSTAGTITIGNTTSTTTFNGAVNLPSGSVSVGSLSLPNGDIIVGSGGNATAVGMSGDASIDNTGHVTVSKFNGTTFGDMAGQNSSSVSISGGTISNSALANGGALTVTAGSGLSGGGSVALGGSTTVSLDVTHGNTWTGAQTFGASGYTSTAPTVLTTDVADWALSATNTYFNISSSTAVNVSGIAGGTDGRMIVLVNTGANAITLKSEDATDETTAANRFHFPGGAGNDMIVAADGTITLLYDGTNHRWRAIGAE